MSLTIPSSQVFQLRRQHARKRLHVISRVRLNRSLSVFAPFPLRLAGSTLPASKPPLFSRQLLPASSRLKNNPARHRTLRNGSRSNRSCVSRALGIQRRGTEFGGMNSPKKSLGIRSRTRGKRFLRRNFLTLPSRLARNVNGNC